MYLIFTVFSVPGGVAATSDIEQRGTYVNYGVQGGTPTYRNTVNLISEYGFETHPVHMMISFGKGKIISFVLHYNNNYLIITIIFYFYFFLTVLKAHA